MEPLSRGKTNIIPSPFRQDILKQVSIDLDLEPWIALTRVSKFAGSMVVFWPFAWGLTMSARTIAMPVVSLGHFYLTVGTIFCQTDLPPHHIIGAGCVWNDILDRHFDAQVERTKHRPIASGRVSIFGAFVFLGAHLLILISMIWDVNHLAWIVGLLALFPLTGIYPLMKRITYWPQAWLGIAINIGVTMSWATTTAAIPNSSLVLSGGCFFWTLWYDTIYACQDKKDDVNAGVKSTAILFGSHVKQILAVFGSVMIMSLLLSGIMNNQSLPFFVFAVFGGAAHLAWQLLSVDVDSPRSCWRTFEANGFYFGAIVETGLVLDYLTH